MLPYHIFPAGVEMSTYQSAPANAQGTFYSGLDREEEKNPFKPPL